MVYYPARLVFPEDPAASHAFRILASDCATKKRMVIEVLEFAEALGGTPLLLERILSRSV